MHVKRLYRKLKKLNKDNPLYLSSNESYFSLFFTLLFIIGGVEFFFGTALNDKVMNFAEWDYTTYYEGS